MVPRIWPTTCIILVGSCPICHAMTLDNNKKLLKVSGSSFSHPTVGGMRMGPIIIKGPYDFKLKSRFRDRIVSLLNVPNLVP